MKRWALRTLLVVALGSIMAPGAFETKVQAARCWGSGHCLTCDWNQDCIQVPWSAYCQCTYFKSGCAAYTSCTPY